MHLQAGDNNNSSSRYLQIFVDKSYASLFTSAATDTASVILTVVGWTNGNGWLGFKVGSKEIGG